MSSEFETCRGRRYRCITEQGVKQWFSLRTNQPMKKATRAQVKTCCPKFQAAFGNFIDRTKVSGAVCIFRKSGAITSGLSKQIGSARPWAFGSEASTHKALAKNSSVLHNPLTREYPFTALHNLSTSESTYLAPPGFSRSTNRSTAAIRFRGGLDREHSQHQEVTACVSC